MAEKELTKSKLMTKFLKESNKLFEVRKAKAITRMRTGSPKLDVLTNGGFPVNAITEIWGPENSGKSTMGIVVAVENFPKAYSEGKYTAILDLEGRGDIEYWIKLGAPFYKDEETGEYECLYHDEDGTPYWQIIHAIDGTGEATMQAILDMVASKLYSIIVLDSVAMLSAKAEQEKRITTGSNAMGLQARLLARATRLLPEKIKTSGTTLVFLNHWRSQTDTMQQKFNSNMSPGGKAFHHAVSLQLETFHPTDDYHDENKGQKKNVKRLELRYYLRKTSVSERKRGLNSTFLVKDKESELYYIDKPEEMFDVAKDTGVFLNLSGEAFKSGNCYFDGKLWGYEGDTYEEAPDGRLAIGLNKSGATKSLKKDKELYLAVKEAIYSKLGPAS